MTIETKNQETIAQGAKPNDKEFNFRQLEAKHSREMAAERAERERLAQEVEELRQSKAKDEDDDSDPYVDSKKLEKKLDKFGKRTQADIQNAMEEVKKKAKDELKQEMWLENNPDFQDVMQKNVEKFFEKAPHLADTILKMPEGFERNKLVYQNIKALGIDRPEPPKSSVQDKIEANRRNYYYVPSGVPSAPYAQQADFSPAGQKNAYDQIQKLKQNLRLG